MREVEVNVMRRYERSKSRRRAEDVSLIPTGTVQLQYTHLCYPAMACTHTSEPVSAIATQ